ncbi:TerC family protein [Ferrimonas gelatinilytica]|uniref:TerC family protein n=1 Tax=Ferrimonas gelatinilytica TaxID=1255257 RepID=A0ABP9SG16_9GAMM
MFDWISSPEAWIALATLTTLEIVLGIDNIIFISILVGRLPAAQRERARRLGLMLAMVTRLALLFSLTWVMGLTEPWFEILGRAISSRDLILIGGGLFLLAKSTLEIHNSLEGAKEVHGPGKVNGMAMVLIQIALLDLVFSLDSVITAVGLAEDLAVMAIAIVLAVVVMLMAARRIGEFVDQHPTVKILALSFLVLVGMTLVVEGFGGHVPKGYVYFAMAFSVSVEMLNLKLRKTRQDPVKLRKPMAPDSGLEGESE